MGKGLKVSLGKAKPVAALQRMACLKVTLTIVGSAA